MPYVRELVSARYGHALRGLHFAFFTWLGEEILSPALEASSLVGNCVGPSGVIVLRRLADLHRGP